MTSETPDNGQESVGVQIANQIINLANSQLESGTTAEEIASGLRHAAANFSAFAFFGSEKIPKDPNDMVDDFINFFEHYLAVHRPKEPQAHGLTDLIAKVKSEF